MKRLTISIDDLATLRYMLNDSDFDPVQFGLLCEIAGAHGISLTLADTDSGVQERDAQLIKQINKSFLNLHIPPEPNLIKTALSINPDMVTFVEISKSGGIKISPVSGQLLTDVLPSVIPDFRANNISVGVFGYPEINTLKHLSRLQVDFVEFDCTEITLASDSNEELVGFDKFNTATLAAAKLGISANCFGGIDYSYLPELAKVPRLEDICMGLSVIKRAMLVGIDRAVQEALQLIALNQRD